MVMADYFTPDRLHELWRQINHLHFVYLETEDSPQKIEQRNKLEECIKAFLYLAPHNRKFLCPETAEVLHRSASNKKDFSGYRAALAWNAIGMYAGNLLSQPWRKEYRQIKTYSGFYKHQIAANLVGAEIMFEAMGYKYVGDGLLVLDGPICPDQVTNVSQDSIVAFVECQILKSIWEEVSSNFSITWLEVLEFRETHLCSLEQSIRTLNYRHHEKWYQEQQQQRYNSSGAVYSTTHYATPRTVVTNDHHQTHASQHPALSAVHSAVQSFPPLSGRTVVSMPVVAPHHLPIAPLSHQTTATYLPHTPAQCIYGTNSYYNYAAYGPLPATFPRYGYTIPVSCPAKTHCLNGCCCSNGYVTTPYSCPVPTAQLIEFDSQNEGYDTPDGEIKHSKNHYDAGQHHYEPNDIHRNGINSITSASKTDKLKPNFDELTLSKAKEDGTGTFESWDYVYRNLESQGYSKDLGERGDLLTSPIENRKHKHERKKSSLEDELGNLNISREIDTKSKNDSLDVEDVKQKPTQSKVLNAIKSKTLTKSSSVTAPEKSAHSATLDIKKLRKNQDIEVTKHKPAKESKSKEKAINKAAVATDKWSCAACTYFNNPSVDICEMCGKSKKAVVDNMAIGGSECPRCTLVNPKNLTSCMACEASLLNSPTYI